MPQVKPDTMAVINKTVVTPPGRKVIIVSPLSMYKAMKAAREIKNILSSTAS